MIRVRCAPDLKRKVYQIAQFKELDSSDIIRIALNDYIQKFKHADTFSA